MGILPCSRLTISPLLSPLASSDKPPSALSVLILHPFSPRTSSSLANSPIKTSKKPLGVGAAWQPPKYVYPDPDPEFAIAETQKFRGEILRKLSKNRDTFGDDIDAVVQVCTEIFSEFLRNEYGGPGTLLVEPFTDMLLALKEKKLQGAAAAARAALLWAQNYVDRDWEIWTSRPSK